MLVKYVPYAPLVRSLLSFAGKFTGGLRNSKPEVAGNLFGEDVAPVDVCEGRSSKECYDSIIHSKHLSSPVAG